MALTSVTTVLHLHRAGLVSFVGSREALLGVDRKFGVTSLSLSASMAPTLSAKLVTLLSIPSRRHKIKLKCSRAGSLRTGTCVAGESFCALSLELTRLSPRSLGSVRLSERLSWLLWVHYNFCARQALHGFCLSGDTICGEAFCFRPGPAFLLGGMFETSVARECRTVVWLDSIVTQYHTM